MTKYNSVTDWGTPPEGNIIGAISASSDFAEIDLGTIHKNTRTMYTNPWGVNAPVYSIVYGYYGGVWSDSTTIHDAYYHHSHGIRSMYSEGRGIFIVTGTWSLALRWWHQLTAFNNDNTAQIYSMPARLMIWKLNT